MTYQGRLADGGVAAVGQFNVRFHVMDAEVDGNILALMIRTVTIDAQDEGVFVVDDLQIANTLNGEDRWLEISVKPAAGASYEVLSPRQPITAAPIASVAASVIDDGINADAIIDEPGIAFLQLPTDFNAPDMPDNTVITVGSRTINMPGPGFVVVRGELTFRSSVIAGASQHVTVGVSTAPGGFFVNSRRTQSFPTPATQGIYDVVVPFQYSFALSGAGPHTQTYYFNAIESGGSALGWIKSTGGAESLTYYPTAYGLTNSTPDP